MSYFRDMKQQIIHPTKSLKLMKKLTIIAIVAAAATILAASWYVFTHANLSSL